MELSLSLDLATKLLSEALAPTATETGPATAAATTAGKLGDGTSGVHDTTVRSPVSSRVERAAGLLVDTEADPGKETLGDVLANEGVADDRVVTVGAGLEQKVARVLLDGHAVSVVGRVLLSGRDEALIKVDLTNVGSATASQGVVGVLGGSEPDDGCIRGQLFCLLICRSWNCLPWIWVARPS